MADRGWRSRRATWRVGAPIHENACKRARSSFSNPAGEGVPPGSVPTFFGRCRPCPANGGMDRLKKNAIRPATMNLCVVRKETTADALERRPCLVRSKTRARTTEREDGRSG